MQARKHAAPPLGDSFFTFGLAVLVLPFGAPWEAAGVTLIIDAAILPVPLPEPKARLVSTGTTRAASARAVIPMMAIHGTSPLGFVAVADCRTEPSHGTATIAVIGVTNDRFVDARCTPGHGATVGLLGPWRRRALFQPSEWEGLDTGFAEKLCRIWIANSTTDISHSQKTHA